MTRSDNDIFADTGYDYMEKSDIEKLTAVLPPEKQAKGRRILEKDYDKQQEKKI